jgi:hypothetical protein
MSVAKFSHTPHTETVNAAWILIVILIALSSFAMYTLIHRVG